LWLVETITNYVLKDSNQMETDNEEIYSILTGKTLNTIKFNSRLNDNEAVVVNEAIHLLEELHLYDNQQINDILRKILQRENQDR
jgi:hypothetical protein